MNFISSNSTAAERQHKLDPRQDGYMHFCCCHNARKSHSIARPYPLQSNVMMAVGYSKHL
jgi:hypothetical protein